MAGVNLNPAALKFFSDIHYADENTMVQQNDGTTKSAGLWSSANKVRWKRSGAEKDANNAIRTELLKSLGTAFGITEGIGTDAKGRTTFSKAFMDRLEKLLGPAFKRSDFFGVFSNSGAVNSGKPLTQRRITAILKQAALVGKAPFSLEAYSLKADAMLASAPSEGILRQTAKKIKSVLDFLKNDLQTLIVENPDYDPDYDPDDVRFTTKYLMNVDPTVTTDKQHLVQSDKDGEGGKKLFERNGVFQCRFTSRTDVRVYIQNKYDMILHFDDNLKQIPHNHDAFPQAMKNYVTNALTTFVKTAIDLYEDTRDIKKTTGKKDPWDMLMLKFTSHNPCMEGWTSELVDLQIALGLVRTEANEAPVKLNVADHTKETPLTECMYKEVGSIMQGRGTETPKWSECRPVLVKNLVGLERPLEKGGEPHKITEADIDSLKDDFTNVLMGEE